jgi:3-methyl-2-oxobutanoate hydroxymethyltransferase
MEKRTVLSLQKKKSLNQPLVALTCYDAASAALIDPYVDIALVGDSLANTRLGYPNTLPVTFEEMLHHVRASARGIRQAFLVADMPFQSYESDPRDAAKLAGRLVKLGGAQAVKVEGGRRIGESIKAILRANIPVMGHLGLVPQSIHVKGGYFVQGRSRKDAQSLLKEALYLESLGVFSLVLEGIPASLGKSISKRLKIPTIGIGAGAGCDGQILVLDDLLGMGDNPTPKFVKKYADLRPQMTRAIASYQREVEQKIFPSKSHVYN